MGMRREVCTIVACVRHVMSDGWVGRWEEHINPCTVRYLGGASISRIGNDGLFFLIPF